ncbi:MAG TPA: Spy/CpxP family protein refolding chaperone [Terriglobia bacterium]|jgi:Spy/CpxP family protein refolding chaperone
MKRLVIIIGWIVLAATVPVCAQSPFEPAFAQSIDDLNGRLTTQLAQLQTSFGIASARNEPTAALQTGLQGTWWREARWIQMLGLTPDQQKKMDDAFRQNRIKLIDLTATLEKAELLLEPLVENIHAGDEGKILAQIDDVANARAELEKTNARMLLAIRQVLTPDQWEKLPKNNNAFGIHLNNGRVIRNGVAPAPPVPPSIPATPDKK